MLILQALLGLVIYDVLNLCCKFKTIYRLVSGWETRNRPGSLRTQEQLCRALDYACACYFKRALCLQRSFVLTYLLRKYGISAEWVLGAQKLPFKAHAWVEVSGKAINERGNVQARYAVWDRA